MWVKPEDYFNFAKNCNVTYFAFDISKLMDELFGESASISGITLDDLNDKCTDLYEKLLDSCPNGTSFEDYAREEIRNQYGDKSTTLQDVIIDIYNSLPE